MRYVGREFPAQLFPVLLFGHVVDDEEHAIEIIIFIDRLDGQQVQSVGPGQFHVTGTVDVLQRIPGYIGQEFLQIALQDFLGLAGAEEMGGPQVEAGNAIGLVCQDDAFLEIFHDETHDIALLFEAAHIVGNGLALQENLIDQRLQFMVDPRRLHHLHVGVVDRRMNRAVCRSGLRRLAVSKRDTLMQARADKPRSSSAQGRRLRKWA